MNTNTDTQKQEILNQLRAFIAQRSGMEWRNYMSHGGDVEGRRALNADRRRIARDGEHARSMLRYVELSSITAGEILEAIRGDRLKWNGKGFDYVTGQYFATEYRSAACSALACVLWSRFRADFPQDKAEMMHNQETGEIVYRYKGMRPYQFIRKQAENALGRSIARRWFN